MNYKWNNSTNQDSEGDRGCKAFKEGKGREKKEEKERRRLNLETVEKQRYGICLLLLKGWGTKDTFGNELSP